MIKVKATVVRNNFRQVKNDIGRATERLVIDLARAVEVEAKQRAAVDTGFMRGSIEVERREDLFALVICGAEYGIFVEYGTVNSPAQPFMTPAGEVVQSRVPQMAKAAFS